MAKELQEKVLMKIGEDRKLSEKEEGVIVILERKGLVEVPEDKLKLTPYGRIITVKGYNSLKRAEEMEENLSNFSSERYFRNIIVLLVIFVLISFALLIIFWMYREDLFFIMES